MKKLIAGLLIACTLFTTSAYASSVDVKTMTTEELVELRNQISEELTQRSDFTDELIYIGDYVVGSDIKAGQYIIKYISEIPDGTGVILVYSSKEEFETDRYNCCVTQLYLEKGQEARLVLEEGQFLRIFDGTLSIRPLLKPSWAP